MIVDLSKDDARPRGLAAKEPDVRVGGKAGESRNEMFEALSAGFLREIEARDGRTTVAAM